MPGAAFQKDGFAGVRRHGQAGADPRGDIIEHFFALLLREREVRDDLEISGPAENPFR